MSKKLMFLAAIVAILAMMIPMSIPVSAAGTLGADQHDIAGDIATFTVSGLVNDNVTSFQVLDVAPTTGAVIHAMSTLPMGNGAWVEVQATTVGEATVIANLASGGQLTAVKKWGEISSSDITPPQDVVEVWLEDNKTFTATTTVSDTIWGQFKKKNPVSEQFTDTEIFAMNGAVINWYLLADTPANEALVAAAGGWLNQTSPLFAAVAAAPKATFATFGQLTVPPGPVVSTMTTTSGDAGHDGVSTVTVNSNGEEPVLVIAIPTYPIATQFNTMLEWTKINFWTSEMEVVPQVRWVGEKIVLEKYFGPSYAGQLVHFSLNMQNATLEGLEGSQLGNLNNTTTSVWDVVSSSQGNAGWARCMLVAQDPGEVIVNLALYNTGSGAGTPENSKIVNQHQFDVYYMKLESITLGNVEGKRAGHDAGLFTVPNPVLALNGADPTTGILNVSQDTLLRARVKGYFMGDRASTRPTVTQDADPTHPNTFLYQLPAGRWVLPDDWAVLAGPNWDEQRIHWDIMNNPGDGVRGIVDDTTGTGHPNSGIGPYVDEAKADMLVAAAPVVGPFRPEMEMPTATGYATAALPGYRIPPQKTVVPNGMLDWWDAPMPPAKITFKILNAPATVDNVTVGNVGYFKDAIKSDIYYVVDGIQNDLTNPFYWAMVPANYEIPAFVNNGGYDWDSWNSAYGPYQFWDIFNRPVNNDLAPRDNANYPAKAQVYSDNHGEAMVYLNGNYKLNPLLFTFKGQDIGFGDTVGSTTVVAMADYPYFRTDNQLISNTVTKTWTWGGMVLGPTETTHEMILSVGDFTGTDNNGPHTGAFDAALNGTSKDKMVWVWATDRDGEQSGVLNTQVDWSITPIGTTTATINDLSKNGVSNYNATMLGINISHGFLSNTNGGIVSTPAGPVYRSWMRAPTTAEKALFNKFWGAGGSHTIIGADGNPLNPNNFVVAAIDLYDPTMTADVTVNAFLTSPDFGTIAYTWNVNFNVSHPLDDVAIAGDANLDGKVTMADVTSIERIILGMDAASYQADANGNGVINMGDVVKAERIILGAK